MANQFSVISHSYCAPYPINLQINTEKGVTYDMNGKRVFYVKEASFTLHNRRVLYDDEKNPIVTLYNKCMGSNGRCNVFMGESNDPSQLLFSTKKIKKSSKIPRGMIKLNVFLANNKDESMCDFRVVVNGSKSSCTVYAGESPTAIIAKMENNGGFNVFVNPYVDYAFIVTLLMIINEMPGGDESTDRSTDRSGIINNVITAAASLAQN
ncbi:hypothetical protein VNO78_15558 [Psophocarpus tetragonolobus]|uniref:Protein LURP-one-related 15 n=1 Tax=Psophocarpus tetragonolobus TaxID=3891 RepID=A0AAN9SF72_PSOTE